MKTRILVVVILFQSLFVFSAQVQPDTLINRYREYLFRTNPPQAETALQWAGSLNAQGQWPDINYEDKEPAAWKIPQHLRRIKEMALAWFYPKSSVYHQEKLFQQINLALDHWLEKRYQSSNWWHNQIGVPQYMRDIIILLHHDLDAVRLKQSLEVMAQLQVHDNYTGGNLVWCADLGLHYGALTGDEKLIKRCRDLILKEIKITTGEGIQPDYSFHQHGKRLQMYQYGKAFLWESMRIAWELRKTPLAFPNEKVDILTDMVLKGWQWMARGVNTVPGTMDRSASRKGELRSPDMRPLIPFIIELYPEKAAELKKMEAVQNGKGSLNGFRYFPYSDFAAFHRPGFSFFLKTISSRTLATEAINNENLKGKLLNSGDAYLIRTGNEYFDLMPVWDWTALPGITAFEGAHQIDRRPFVGGVSDGENGLSVMDYVLTGKTGKQSLSARKFWACYQDVVVCLLSAIKAENITGPVYTALDQCRWQGDVTVNKPGNVLSRGEHQLTDVKWIHHSGFAYIPLQPASFNLQLKQVSGSWLTINASETAEPVIENIFMPKLLHDSLQEGQAGYVLASCKSPKAAKRLFSRPSWKVLRNDKDCQAVAFKNGPLMLAFYTAGAFKTAQWQVKTDKSCLMQLVEDKLYVSDPAHQGGIMNVEINSQVLRIELPADGTTRLVELELKKK